MANNHSFNSYLKNSRIFSLVLYGFTIVTGWTGLEINLKHIFLNAVASLKTTMVVGFTIKKIALGTVESLINLIIAQTQTINLSKITLSMVLSQLVKYTVDITIKGAHLQNTLPSKWNFNGSVLTLKHIALDFIPVVASYWYLNHWDGELLQTLDALNLSDMEYRVT